MPDLSFVEASSLSRFISEIDSMKRGKSQQKDKPHKLVLLLAIINLFDKGIIRQNRIYFDDDLVQEFTNVFSLIGAGDDWCQPAPPFFHMRSSSFWLHKVISGREDAYAKITTSGGGIKRIVENIEYAYFADYAFAVLTDTDLRKALRDHVVSILNPKYTRRASIPKQLSEHRSKIKSGVSKEGNMNERIGTMFHETIVLNREAIRQVLNAVVNYADLGSPERISLFDYIQEETNLGNNYIKAMPSYATGCGLLNFNKRLTQFGQLVQKNDPSMLHPATQWLMHYYMSAPNGPGPQFWHKLICQYMVPGNSVGKDEILHFLVGSIESVRGQAIAEDSLKSTRTIFARAYIEGDALGNLGILTEDGDGYVVNYPEPASIWVMGAALLEYWQACFPGQRMINLNEIIGESDFARIFMVGTRSINRMLAALQEIRYIDLFTTAPPYGVALLRNDLSPLLERMYTSDEID